MDTYKDNSKIHGFGLFTNDYIKKGVKIIEVADLKRFHQNLDWITAKGKLVNHSKNGNCSVNVVMDKYYLVSIRDIEPNEELTSDYSVLEYPFKNDIQSYK